MSEEVIRSFEQEIKRQEEILYGIALFFEGTSLLYDGQEAILETHRKQFRNIIQTGQKAAEHAQALLEQARNDASKTKLLQEFKFASCEGHPDPAAMTQRALALVEAYKRLFPDRPRSQPFTEAETLKLMDEAAGCATTGLHPRDGRLP